MRAAVAALLDVLGVVLHVAAVQHGVLRRGDVDERRLHAGQHVLHPADVDVAVDLADVVGRPADVVLDQVAALEHGHLRHVLADLDAHEVAADRPTVALAASALLGRPPSPASAGAGLTTARRPAAACALGRRRSPALGARAVAARRRCRPAGAIARAGVGRLSAPGGCRRSAACGRAPARPPRRRPALAERLGELGGSAGQRLADRRVGVAGRRPRCRLRRSPLGRPAPDRAGARSLRRLGAARRRRASQPGVSGSRRRCRPWLSLLACPLRGTGTTTGAANTIVPIGVVLDPIVEPAGRRGTAGTEGFERRRCRWMTCGSIRAQRGGHGASHGP